MFPGHPVVGRRGWQIIERTRLVIDYQGFVCDNDADATEWARQLVDGHDIELWSGGRFVIRLERKPK
jgi:hypothetical protein